VQRYLAATPPYLGSKRAIARQILRVMTAEGAGPGSTVADAFAGGCALSLAAKALGYRVLANDLSPISEAIGKAVVENSRRQLERELVGGALLEEPNGVKVPPKKVLNLPENVRGTLAGMVTFERKTTGVNRWLLRAWIAKTASSMSAWGIPTMSAGGKEWEDWTVGSSQALTATRSGHPMRTARRTARELNGGIFDNGHANTMSRSDAVDFIKGVKADVLYLDPPYPGTLDYETTYRGIVELLDPGLDQQPSEWSRKQGWRLLEDVFKAGDHIPLWVVSMGRNANLDAIEEMIADAGREPSWIAIAHRHIRGLKAHHDAEGDELLIVGKAK
jgi:adenine-specific DNA-methyltransferase